MITSASAAASGLVSAKTDFGGGILKGIQISPHSLLDEGIERCLDFIQQHTGINSIFLYSQTYHLGDRPLSVLAKDHPTQPRDPAKRDMPRLWMRLPEAPFAGLSVKHASAKPDQEYGKRDLFNELIEPCRKRGIKIYARILEADSRHNDRIPGYQTVQATDLDGGPSHGPCWNHPDYREWIRLTIDEMTRLYPLDGLQYGAERVGALSEVLFRGMKPACFCEHCIKRNRAVGIDPDRAREGYRRLYNLMAALEAGKPKPVDGVMTVVLREIFNYPEVLGWYREWFKADQEIQTLVYQAAKARRPACDVGQHIDHQRSSWDIFYRATAGYQDMAEHNDFIKPIVYHDILGPRMKEWVVDRIHDRVLGDLSREQSLDLFYALFGHAPENEPKFHELMKRGLSPEYVHREVKRCVEAAGDKARVYAGIGFDVPTYTATGMEPFPGDPANVTLAVKRSLDAGAHGVVASREYDEMTLPNLKAFGKGCGM